MTRRSLVTLAVAGSLLLTACGQRLDPSTRQALLDQSVGRGPAGTSGGSAQGALPGATNAPVSPGAGVATSGPTGPGVLGPSSGPVANATAPPGGNGGATDVAVTANSITVGTVADQTGPQPGLFNGDIAGVRAYFAYVNSQGGVFGRKLQTTAADSALDCNTTTNAYNGLVNNIFAFVGNLSIYDNCGAAVLRAHPQVPDVSFQLTPEHAQVPTSFSAQPTAPGARTGPVQTLAKAFPEVRNAVGAVYSDVSAGREQWASEKRMLQATGFTIVYEKAVPATEVDYTQYVIGMRQANVKMAMVFMSAQLSVKFVNEAQQQGFSPPVIESPGTFYDPYTLQALNKSVTNLYTDLVSALYANADEAQRIRGVATYQTWMRKTAPDQALDYYSVFGWTHAALFVDALRRAGPRATRAGLLAALKGIHKADADGLIASGDPGARKPPACYLIAHLDNGVWRRWHSPPTGFLCDAPYHYD